ncbi:MAG: phenylalanine--tRNA ligase subunit beta [Peptococcaceae bacterium]|nr:phenylalanine--tRNA ligase subunit beta [Peptococcaceae bacterium]
MRVSWKWLGSMVDLTGYSPRQLADILTHGGVEVGSVEPLHPGLSRVIIGEIVSEEKHPNAETLRVCAVDVGGGLLGAGIEPMDHTGAGNGGAGLAEGMITIVSGAPNIFRGDKVPVALPGAELPRGEGTLKERDLRGITSFGMMCGEKELGLGVAAGLPVGTERSREGVLILPGDAPVGAALADYLELEDWVLDLELYPNRPDCLAMIHVAQEVGALINRKAALPSLKSSQKLWASDRIPDITIEASDWSWRYSALIVDNSVVEPSPMWLQNRLRAAGVRPISNIVDLTNYCMLERGQPLHAFDLDKLDGDICVRRACVGESLITLDGVERSLDENMLVIADGRGPVAIAGVMGGLDTEVTEGTRRVLFESAHFQGACVRRTSRRLGLRSESSTRFEKGTDVTGTVSTLERLADLLKELSAGQAVGFREKVVHLPEKTTICLDTTRISKVLGVTVEAEQTLQAMERQEFECRQRDDGVFEVDIPPYRQDLKIEEDLIEEVARMIGYDLIPATLPHGAQTQGERSEEQIMRRRLRRVLVEAGMNEVITYAFVRQKEDGDWGYENRQIPLLNPLREDMSVMRTSLIPGLLTIAARNMSRQSSGVSLFEIGNVYLKKSRADSLEPIRELPDEMLKIAGITCGRGAKHWAQGNSLIRQGASEYGFFHMKGSVEALAELLGVALEFRRPDQSSGGEGRTALLHPGRSAEIFAGGHNLGFVGELNPKVAENWDLHNPVVFELDFQELMRAVQDFGHGLAARTITAKGYPRFPAIQRDLAVVTDEAVPAGAVERKIRELGGPLLIKVDIFDVYTGLPILPGYKNLAFSLHYQSSERTLTDEEVTEANQRILCGIQEEFGAEWRKT